VNNATFKDDSGVVKELTAWFKQRLEQSDVQFGDEPMSYEANTRYDIQFYRLQKEAAEHWQNRHGFVPTPGQLMQGFFGAEYERFRKAKFDSLPWTGKLKWFYARALRAISRFFKQRRPHKNPLSGNRIMPGQRGRHWTTGWPRTPS
jgi:hypothetical protein